MYLDVNGLKEFFHEYECKRTPAGYKVDRESNYGGKTTIVKSAEIMKVDSMTVNRVDLISFYTWFLKETDKEAATKMLWNDIRSLAEQNRKAANLLIEYLQ